MFALRANIAAQGQRSTLLPQAQSAQGQRSTLLPQAQSAQGKRSTLLPQAQSAREAGDCIGSVE
jgi:hypothetical protein